MTTASRFDWAAAHLGLNGEIELDTLRAILVAVWDEGWYAGASWPQDDVNPYKEQP